MIKSRATCNFSRCGRTDKGVHAAGNYFAVNVRKMREEIDYCKALNSVLPNDIQVVGSIPVEDHFDARFHCLYRIYKYYMLAEGLDVELMRDASKQFFGTHDFRNFCKMDVDTVRHFRRRIINISIRAIGKLLEIEIIGLSFLWHQVRCMMAILQMVGSHDEPPSIISNLLDINLTPRKPV